jgi:hypothetical protein
MRPEICAAATQIGGNILATSIASDVSDPFEKPDDSDHVDADPSIYAGRPRLRALGTEWSVEV